ncbi:unnamed protein product [Closterium sp. NIES-65]|nr:unnamed protein product [Closterium sp. NIES-65]
MADLQALRDELLGQLCRRCAGCDKHDANGEGGGTQDGGSKSVKEPVRVKSPEEIARDFINAETGGWQQTLKTVSVTYTNTRCLIAKRLRKKVLGALGIKRRNDHEGVEDPDDAELLIGHGNEPLQGTAAPDLLLFPHLRYPPALLSSQCKARQRLTCSFPPISVSPLPLLSAWKSHCKARQRLKCSFPPISVLPLPYSLPGRANAGQPMQGSHCKARQRLTCSFPPISLEYPILEKTADGKLSSKPDYNRPLYEEKVKWCRKWVEHAITNLGVSYDAAMDVFVFGNGILIDASDYAAGFKKTTIVLQ